MGSYAVKIELHKFSQKLLPGVLFLETKNGLTMKFLLLTIIVRSIIATEYHHIIFYLALVVTNIIVHLLDYLMMLSQLHRLYST
jgi:hypothetical protein